jgi:hypothetical protein
MELNKLTNFELQGWKWHMGTLKDPKNESTSILTVVYIMATLTSRLDPFTVRRWHSDRRGIIAGY